MCFYIAFWAASITFSSYISACFYLYYTSRKSSFAAIPAICRLCFLLLPRNLISDDATGFREQKAVIIESWKVDGNWLKTLCLNTKAIYLLKQDDRWFDSLICLWFVDCRLVVFDRISKFLIVAHLKWIFPSMGAKQPTAVIVLHSQL